MTPINPQNGKYIEFPTPQVIKDYIWKKLHPVRKLTAPVSPTHAKDMLINLFCGARKYVPTYYDENGRRKFVGTQEI